MLGAPLDVILVRKLGVPGHRELAMGAIGEGGVRVVDAAILRATGVDARDLARVEADERIELERRAGRYREDRPRIALAGRDALIVDDGLATGSTARAAIAVARAMDARRVVLAVPVAPPDTVRALDDGRRRRRRRRSARADARDRDVVPGLLADTGPRGTASARDASA